MIKDAKLMHKKHLDFSTILTCRPQERGTCPMGSVTPECSMNPLAGANPIPRHRPCVQRYATHDKL